MAMLECKLHLDATDEHDRILKCNQCMVPWSETDSTLTHVVGVHMDRTGYKGRMNVVIEVECEAGHGFDVVLHQHKGQTFLGVDGLHLVSSR